jgi:hypothetical protein
MGNVQTLSTRAQTYLSTLHRGECVAMSEVRRRYDALELELLPAWTEFHTAFGGFELPLGLESANLGLVHGNSSWCPELGFDYDVSSEGTLVTCADAHPSFDFWLDESGSLLASGAGGQTESFSKYIEQRALIASLGPEWHLDLATSPTELEQIIHLLAEPDLSASDRHSTWFHGNEWLISKREEFVRRGARRITAWHRVKR